MNEKEKEKIEKTDPEQGKEAIPIEETPTIEEATPAEESESQLQSGSSPELEASLEFLRKFDVFWKGYIGKIYQAKMELTDPLLPKINNLRQAIRFYLIPLLQKTGKLSVEQQSQFIKQIPFLFSEEQTLGFFDHFYGVKKDTEKGWCFTKRDPYQADELVLFDLYKVKRTMNGINQLLNELKTSRQDFPSSFKRDRQTEILKGMNSALFMAFKLAIKPEYQVELFKNISLNYVYEDQIAERRKKTLIYSRGEGPDSNPYRRVFFHLLFRDTINTRIKGKETKIHYNLVEFEQLLEEYFTHFLDDSGTHAESLKIFHYFHIQGKPFSKGIIDAPDQETLLFEDIDEIKTLL
jgi:hypothetical protein